MLYLPKYAGRRHLVSVGGGYTSTIELPLRVIAKYGAENVDLVIAALAGEHPDLWRLVSEAERLTGLTATKISYRPTPPGNAHKALRPYLVNAPESMWLDIWDIFDAEGMMGNSLADPCSRKLKRETIRAYIEDQYTPDNIVIHVGITKDEIDRMLAIRANWTRQGYHVEADLCEIDLKGSSAERAACRLGWVPELYAQSFPHHNCGGFCVKAGHREMARLLWFHRDTYLYHEMREQQFQARHKTTSTIMRDRKTVNGETTSTPLSLRQFRERMEARWRGRLPGFDPFEELESTPPCRYCAAVA